MHVDFVEFPNSGTILFGALLSDLKQTSVQRLTKASASRGIGLGTKVAKTAFTERFQMWRAERCHRSKLSQEQLLRHSWSYIGGFNTESNFARLTRQRT